LRRLPLGTRLPIKQPSNDRPKTSNPDLSEAHTVDAYPYSLPEGLADGIEVTVLGYDRRTYNHLVRDPKGREWTIQALQNLDAGSEYLLGRAGYRKIIRSFWRS